MLQQFSTTQDCRALNLEATSIKSFLWYSIFRFSSFVFYSGFRRFFINWSFADYFWPIMLLSLTRALLWSISRSFIEATFRRFRFPTLSVGFPPQLLIELRGFLLTWLTLFLLLLLRDFIEFFWIFQFSLPVSCQSW